MGNTINVPGGPSDAAKFYGRLKLSDHVEHVEPSKDAMLVGDVIGRILARDLGRSLARDVPPREATGQNGQSIALLNLDRASRLPAKYVQFVVSPRTPGRLPGKVFAGFHLRRIAESTDVSQDSNCERTTLTIRALWTGM